jgi:hypothetical protein
MLDHFLVRIRGSELGIRFHHGTTSGFELGAVGHASQSIALVIVVPPQHRSEPERSGNPVQPGIGAPDVEKLEDSRTRYLAPNPQMKTR